MKTELIQTCETIIRNKKELKSEFGLVDGRMLTVCASLYKNAGRPVDGDRVAQCKKQIKERVSVFSEIRGQALTLLACMIDIRGGREEHFEQLLSAYRTLREEFHASPFLAVAAELLAENYAEVDYVRVTEKAKRIYKNMQQRHWLITGKDDYIMCVLLAQSDRDADDLGAEIEACFSDLKERGLSMLNNALQGVSCTLALYEGETGRKTQRLLELYSRIHEDGRYDKRYGLPVLAVLSQLDIPAETLAEDVREVSDWLKGNHALGLLSGGALRRMFAAMIVSQTYSNDKNVSTSAAGGVMAAIIAEQVAMMSCVAASSAAASNSNS